MMTTLQARRIGVLTGGGDCPGLNAVIRAVAKTAILEHGLEVLGIQDGFLGLIEGLCHPLNVQNTSNILDRGGTILGASNKADPERYRTGTSPDGQPVYENVSDRVARRFHEWNLDVLVCIGGDGTMSGAANLIRHGIPCVGVPKTIDNDLMHCDPTFGFQTAVNTATDALDRIRTTAASHHRVMLVETMGRNAGWLNLHAGIAAGADIILIPEIPYDVEVVADFCLMRAHHGRSFTIIAVSEGARPKGGQVTIQQMDYDSPDPVRLGGVSQVLSEQIAKTAHLQCRATVLGHVQRGGRPCPFDRVLATRYGHEALQLVVRGEWDRIVVMQDGRLTSVPITEVANKQRLVPPDHPLIATARGVGTCLGDKIDSCLVRWDTRQSPCDCEPGE
jgi:6-phosphofructokinase 1